MVDQFAGGMSLMRKHDPQLQEDGFGLVQEVAAERLDDLIAAYGVEQDHGMKCWLLELIGEVRTPAALPVLSNAPTGQDQLLRDWARRGLELLNTKEARTLLWQEQQDQPPR
ncbi:HEAT repeat domain-containing protein [Kribbella sp. VKM Ac-2568]|uniref:HEAT repeat domain-containing protein n=1 Tax=Kribbella sp. VKM Ac-2568 TaxID=2512219 RepID=UPI001046B874|nr:HEAT repeat domain-containing protein [Kribbella sp. VKM Ac-2568]TCM38896.1 hypothetical protein EV648_11513 [Kribbella sp. VKM Ac-2568]